MNELIKEIEKETWREVSKLGVVKWVDWRNQFAELIIEKCLSITERYNDLGDLNNLASYDRGWIKGRKDVGKDIREHFGLEQRENNN